MDQLTQKLKNGEMKIIEVPIPSLSIGHILVRNYYSLISAGTESSTVKAARASYIEKAKQRPQQVKQVIETLMSQGVTQTYRAVMKKLDAYSPLGYSSVGEVIAMGANVTEFKKGDLVACGGLTASHAEIIAVPVNLCVKIRPESDLKQAAYNTLGAIALQGVRQADMRLGETCAVIGMGLLGQLTALLLRASGIRVIGVDVDQKVLDISAKRSVDLALQRDGVGIEGIIHEFTGSIGCDAVIITAASASLDPINFAGAISRKKGTIVIVGAVPSGFDREPHFYKKELQVKMSCSYGPGRYDPEYEEKGIDYPAAYVRWTENRNMAAFQDLIYSKKIEVDYLTTHVFRLEDACQAYDLILNKTEPYIGILIEYEKAGVVDVGRIQISSKENAKREAVSQLNIGFIGAGSYAQSHLLPNIPKDKNVALKGIVTASGISAKSVGERFGFEYCSGNAEDILNNNQINCVFIATRHDSHAEYVMKALKSGKHVFVEKPLCLNEKDLAEIGTLYGSIPAATPLYLLVGYNRRFSPLTKIIKDTFKQGPISITYRINAGAIPRDSWIQDRDIGGGRIVGEVCHFVDFVTYINGSLPTKVFAASMDTADCMNDTLNISLNFENGSIATISYFTNGDKNLPKERVEVYSNGATAVLDDFKILTIYAGGKRTEKKLMSQDKGQKLEVNSFINAILEGKGQVIPFREIYAASLTTIKIEESLRTCQCCNISSDIV